jgi:hypothetical protein
MARSYAGAMSERSRINEQALAAAMFQPKAQDFGRTAFFMIVGVFAAVTLEIVLFSDRSVTEELPFLLKFVAAVAIFVFLEAWVFASYEQMLLPLKIVELEQQLRAGNFERVRVDSQIAFHRFAGQYWPRTAVKKIRAISGHKTSGGFDGYLVPVARRPFFFKKWVVLPVGVLE